MDNSLLTPILASPELPKYLAQLQFVVDNEAKKRQQFYNLISEKDKAEFINGEMIMHSPVMGIHNTVGLLLLQMINAYVYEYEMGYVGYEKIMVHLTRNSYEPDLCFFLYEKSQHFTDEQMLFPAPDFVVEILSKSTEKTDRGVKMIDYAAHGVLEYWLIQPKKRIIEKYLLDEITKNKFYLEKKYTIENEIQSNVISGLRFPVISIFEKEETLKVVKQIMKNEIAPDKNYFEEGEIL